MSLNNSPNKTPEKIQTLHHNWATFKRNRALIGPCATKCETSPVNLMPSDEDFLNMRKKFGLCTRDHLRTDQKACSVVFYNTKQLNQIRRCNKYYMERAVQCLNKFANLPKQKIHYADFKCANIYPTNYLNTNTTTPVEGENICSNIRIRNLHFVKAKDTHLLEDAYDMPLIKEIDFVIKNDTFRLWYKLIINTTREYISNEDGAAFEIKPLNLTHMVNHRLLRRTETEVDVGWSVLNDTTNFEGDPDNLRYQHSTNNLTNPAVVFGQFYNLYRYSYTPGMYWSDTKNTDSGFLYKKVYIVGMSGTSCPFQLKEEQEKKVTSKDRLKKMINPSDSTKWSTLRVNCFPPRYSLWERFRGKSPYKRKIGVAYLLQWFFRTTNPPAKEDLPQFKSIKEFVQTLESIIENQSTVEERLKQMNLSKPYHWPRLIHINDLQITFEDGITHVIRDGYNPANRAGRDKKALSKLEITSVRG